MPMIVASDMDALSFCNGFIRITLEHCDAAGTGHPRHQQSRVEGLRNRDERHAVTVEHLDQLGEVVQRAAEAVDLVDHDHVNQPVLNALQQPHQAKPFQRTAGDAAVVILITD